MSGWFWGVMLVEVEAEVRDLVLHATQERFGRHFQAQSCERVELVSGTYSDMVRASYLP